VRAGREGLHEVQDNLGTQGLAAVDLGLDEHGQPAGARVAEANKVDRPPGRGAADDLDRHASPGPCCDLLELGAEVGVGRERHLLHNLLRLQPRPVRARLGLRERGHAVAQRHTSANTGGADEELLVGVASCGPPRGMRWTDARMR
jgi:hypothetical protein